MSYSSEELKLIERLKQKKPLTKAKMLRAENSISKKCSVCKESKLLGEFNKQTTGSLGRRGCCRECQSNRNKKDYIEKKRKIY
jgi:hypothetical protein